MKAPPRSSSLEDLVGKLTAPRAVWVMVPAGGPTENTVQSLLQYMQPGDTIIDGGNSYFKDDVRRSRICKSKGVHYVDVGTSGGVWGLDRGYCMMIGGPDRSGQRVSIRSSRRWLLAAATSPALRAARKWAAPLKTATSTAAPPAPGTS